MARWSDDGWTGFRSIREEEHKKEVKKVKVDRTIYLGNRKITRR